MSARDFTSRQFITGAIVLTVATALVVWFCYIAYAWVGYTFITWLTIAFAGFYGWQYWHFRKHPVKERAYLINLHKAFWRRSKASTFVLLMQIFNGAALLALLIHGWWIAVIGGAIMSVIVTLQVKKAEYIMVAQPL